MKTLQVLVLLGFVAAAPASPVDDLIRQGNVYDTRQEPDEALKYYLPAEKIESENPGLLVRIARQYSYKMTSPDATAGETVKLGNIALGYSERAVKLAPDLCDAQLAIAISHGKLLPYLDNQEKIKRSAIIKTAAEKAVKLDPSNDIAWHLVGRWHQLLADISGLKRLIAELVYGTIPTASLTESERCLKKALELNPNRLMHHIELGRTYAKMGRNEEARKFIEQGLAMPEKEIEDRHTKERGRETLADLPAAAKTAAGE